MVEGCGQPWVLLPHKFECRSGHDKGGTVGVKKQVKPSAIRVGLASVRIFVHDLTEHQSQAEAPPKSLPAVEINPAIERCLHIVGWITADTSPVARLRDIQFK